MKRALSGRRILGRFFFLSFLFLPWCFVDCVIGGTDGWYGMMNTIIVQSSSARALRFALPRLYLGLYYN